MEKFKTFLAIFSAFCWLAQAGVIHLDFTDSGDVKVDIESESHQLQSEKLSIEGNDNLEHQTETQKTVSDKYDVALPYEVHRGFLSNDSSYVKFSNIPFAEPPVGSLRFKAPVPPQKKSEDVNKGLEERVCPQYQVGWVPKAFEFLNCYAGALNEPPSCSFKDNWTTPIDASDYPNFDGQGILENCSSRPFP
ncbi:MAG: hypothetical protein Q9195_005252 [Heterodermia aff. obscurata]